MSIAAGWKRLGLSMSVRVEFFGIARQRAGVEAIDVSADDLGDLFEQLSSRLPHFAESCLDNGRLRSAFIVNVNGTNFTTESTTPLTPGDTVLILSADAGG